MEKRPTETTDQVHQRLRMMLLRGTEVLSQGDLEALKVRLGIQEPKDNITRGIDFAAQTQTS